MTYYILVIWTTISIAGTQFTVHEKKGWIRIGEFYTLESCNRGAAEIGAKPNEFRCLKK